MKPFMIFVEGQDRVGKSSIIKNIFEGRKKIDNVFDRGPLSNLVYNKLFCRCYNEEHYYSILKSSDRMLIIYLTCDVDKIIKRTKDTNDYNVCINDIPKHKVMFEYYANILKGKNINLLHFDTSNTPINMLSKKIIEKINEIDKNAKE